MNSFKKHFVALAAPSGGGKTTLCRMLLAKYPSLCLSISFTTRAPRGAEKNGVEYNFVSEAEFKDLIAKESLIEWAKVHGNYYGTSKVFLEKQCQGGNVVLLDVDVQGVESLKKAFGERCLSIFVMPPSIEELEKRLRARMTESEEKLLERLLNARDEMMHAPKFDHQLVNHTLDKSFAELCAIVEKEVGIA